MARRIKSGWRGAVSVRMGMILGIMWVTLVAFAVPALAEDGYGSGASGHNSGNDQQTARSDDPGSDDNGDGSGDGGDHRNGAGDDKASSADNENSDQVEGTPCTKPVRVCVELKSQQAWLIDTTGAIMRGPVKVSSGGPGEETPVGSFTVLSKDKNHKSAEVKEPDGQGAPMPYSVFFAKGGVALHGGSLTRASAGCVHLNDDDAIIFYNTLKIGDQVQVH